MKRQRSVITPSILSPTTGQPKTTPAGRKRTDKTGDPLPVCAAEVAKLDGATRPAIATMEAELKVARTRLKAESDPLKRLQWRGAVAPYKAALAALRVGPYGG